jgi:hypothetical protein
MFNIEILKTISTTMHNFVFNKTNTFCISLEENEGR